MVSRTFSDGSWIRYEYDRDGRLSTETRSWLDAASGASGDSAQTITYDYTVQSSEDSDNILDSRLPRKVTRYIQGIEAGTTWYLYKYDSENNRIVISEESRSQGSSFGSQSNLRSQETTYALVLAM